MRIFGQANNNKCVYAYLDRLTTINAYAYRRYLFSALCRRSYSGVEFVLFTMGLGFLASILHVLNGRTETRASDAGISETSFCGGCDNLRDRNWLYMTLGFGLCLLLYLLKQ